MTRTAPRIVILGGGTAGWITAALFAKAWGEQGGAITLVEISRDRDHWRWRRLNPQLKALFDHIDVPEAEWMAACDATWKLGIRFTGWSERPGFESYFHPFACPIDLHSEPAFVRNCALARRGFEVPAHPDRFYLAARLAEAGQSPQADPRFPFAPSYGYHFDAFKLGGFLRDHCTGRGVGHLQRKVEQVELAANGEVAALLCAGGERITGDFFVDCSGFRGVIAQERLGARFLPLPKTCSTIARWCCRRTALQASSRRPMRSRWPRAGAGRSR